MKNLQKIILRSSLLAAFSIALGGVALAQSLKDKEKIKTAEDELKSAVESTNTTCGTSITASYDFTKLNFEELQTNSISDYCGSTLTSLSRVCGTEEGKKTVKEKIKKLVCLVGDKRDLTLSKETGELKLTIKWSEANYDDFTYDYLMANL